jgi:hypothetical protein
MILWNARRSHRTIVHYATLAVITKTASRCLLAATLLFGLTASAQKEHPISTNGKPLVFRLTRATVTREPQWTVQLQLPNGITSPDQLQMQQKSVWLRLDPSESFVIIEFSISNVQRKLDLSTGDVQLIDGKGSSFEPFGISGTQKGQWCEIGSGSMELNKKGQWSAICPFCGIRRQGNNDAIAWLFKAPTIPIPGAKIVFQGATYPLPVGN